MRCKTFSRLCFFLLFIASVSILYKILFVEPDKKDQNRINNFSNISKGSNENIQIHANDTLSKFLQFTHKKTIFNILLRGKSSVITVKKDDKHLYVTEAIKNCTVQLQQTSDQPKLGVYNAQINAKNAQLLYQNPAITFNQARLTADTISKSGQIEPFCLTMHECTLAPQKEHLLVAKDVTLISNNFVLEASHALMDLTNKKIFFTDEQNKTIIYTDHTRHIHGKAKNCTLDFSHGFRHYSLKSDGVVTVKAKESLKPLLKKAKKHE